MSEAEIIAYASKALMLVLLLSLPPIIVAALVGTLVSLVQALTQIQEQTISFAFKLIAVVVTLALIARWLGIEIFNYALGIFDAIPRL
ncbi:MAG TPA: type III secretion system export apparatus subunit SctS [Candidatus Competibacter sp.]|nr:type III secretion system export apparatus subunit SctS [Candidatus Competibacteraceae bacterium]HUM95842.1 type III secretion system export apparatus subunit SctS [Candidatus Competibacter sp.]